MRMTKEYIQNCYNSIKNNSYTKLAIISCEKLHYGLSLLLSITILNIIPYTVVDFEKTTEYSIKKISILEYFKKLKLETNYDLRQFLRHMHILRQFLYKELKSQVETIREDLHKFKIARICILENITLVKEFKAKNLFLKKHLDITKFNMIHLATEHQIQFKIMWSLTRKTQMQTINALKCLSKQFFPGQLAINIASFIL
jgi:hypothetical protein